PNLKQPPGVPLPPRIKQMPEGVESPRSRPLFNNCWGCRVLTGSGVIAAGAYVFQAARRTMRRGGPTSMGTVAQVTFAVCLASWGIVILTDPVGKFDQKK
uniref:Distal membrane-arm assembly complex protein 1-like domain-containing protein n=1 Tax=Latimeria chalumnae TaxID=7897 RepID=H3BEV3_LATCH